MVARVWIILKVVCCNVMVLSLDWWLTVSKTVTITQSCSPIALCAKHRNACLEQAILHLRNRETISYRSKWWYWWLSEMRCRDGWHDNSWMLERMDSQIVLSGIWHAPLRWPLSYLSPFYPSIFVLFMMWLTLWYHFSNKIAGSTYSMSSGPLHLHILAKLDSPIHIARYRTALIRWWKHLAAWSFPCLRLLCLLLP
jgi:hypothetical protein